MQNGQSTLSILDIYTHLGCRPSQLYLGALMSRQKLSFFVYWDSNAYSDDLVREWAEEVKAAAVHYLGQNLLANENIGADIVAKTKL